MKSQVSNMQILSTKEDQNDQNYKTLDSKAGAQIKKKMRKHKYPSTWKMIRESLKELKKIKISKTLSLLVPFMICVEICLNWSMLIVPPDHDVHFSRYCAMCGIDPGTDLKSKIDLLKAGNSASVLEAVAWEKCLSDEMLTTSGESFQTFTQNFLASLLGHLLTTYALLASNDGLLADGDLTTAGMIHFFGYLVLLVDVVIEMIFLIGIEMKDTEHVEMHQYCDGEVVHLIHNHKGLLVAAGLLTMQVRIAVTVAVTLAYIYNNPQNDDDEDDEDDQAPKASDNKIAAIKYKDEDDGNVDI